MAMTSDELDTLAGIAAAVRRVEATLAEHGTRLAALERSATRMDGALTFGKWLLGLVGFGGITLIVWAMARGGT